MTMVPFFSSAPPASLIARLEHAHRRLEGQRGLHELGQEDVFALELLADDVEAGQQALVDDLARVHAVGQGLVDGLEDGVLVLVDDRLLELFVHGLVSHYLHPFFSCLDVIVYGS